MSPQKLALWFLIVSVSISALLGILAILSGTFGDLEGRIILTTITISAASICALAAGALWENRGARVLPRITVALATLAATIIIFGIWAKISGEEFWKFAATIGVLAIACSQACLVSLAQLAPRFAWTRIIALIAIFFLALLINIPIHGEVTPGEGFFRMIGATAILVAALTIMMPIFHRLSRGDLFSEKAGTSVDQHLFPTVLCPRCGNTQPNSYTQITCTSCGCRFVVTILNEPSATQPS